MANLDIKMSDNFEIPFLIAGTTSLVILVLHIRMAGQMWPHKKGIQWSGNDFGPPVIVERLTIIHSVSFRKLFYFTQSPCA